jgi:hypothetical protein
MSFLACLCYGFSFNQYKHCDFFNIGKEMKDIPILYQTEMVRSILRDEKTETRRIMKPQPKPWGYPIPVSVPKFLHAMQADMKGGYKIIYTTGPFAGHIGPEPRWQEGDRLWVKESFYDRADYAKIGLIQEPRFFYKADEIKNGWRIRPSIHMPKIAARIWLDVVSVTPERLLDITEAGALAEGVKNLIVKDGAHLNSEGKVLYFNYLTGHYSINNAVDSFLTLWSSINGVDSTKQNPAVWVIKFQRYGQ